MMWQWISTGLAGLALALGFLYSRYWARKFSYWRDRAVPHVPGSLPYGSDKDLTLAHKFLGDVLARLVKKMPGVPYFGVYVGVQPVLVLREPEAVKTVLAKEFSHFKDRSHFTPAPGDVLARHLFLLKGDEWRALRVKMSPVFTSGKLKAMFPLFLQCAEAMEELLLAKAESEVQVKQLAVRFSMEVICSCAFGLEAGSIKNEDSPFNKIGRQSDLTPPWKRLVFTLLARYLPFFTFSSSTKRITPQALEDFMVRTIRETVEHREKTGLKRNDFIDLLLQLRGKGNLAEGLVEEAEDGLSRPVEMSMELMTAQCFVFFAAGHETSSSVKSFCLYELALDQELQERLRREIWEVLERHGGLTYQAVQEMALLDQVVNETLRKYPTLHFLERVCTKDYTFPDGGRVGRGTRVLVPLWALHRDPAHFPEPERFRPERFSPEQRTFHPYAFIPFGEGPRICIGMRFGQLQTKVGLITFLKKFQVLPTEKTEAPLQFLGSSSPLTSPTKPIYLKLVSTASSTTE